MTLSCPGCHAKHRFRDDIAIGKTVYVRCPSCNHMMMISPQVNNPAAVEPRPKPEEAPALPPEVAAAIAAARANLWRLELLDFAREELDTDQVQRQIERGAISEDDLIAHVDRNDWQRVAELPEFASALARRAQLAAADPVAEEPPEEASEAETPVEPEIPYARDIVRVLRYPFAERGYLALLINAVFFLLASLSFASLALVVFNLAYALTIVRESALGSKVAPGWDAFSDILDIFARSVRLMLVSLVAWLPVIVLNVLIFYGPLTTLSQGPMTELAPLDEDLPAYGGIAMGPVLGLVRRLTPLGVVANVLLSLMVMLAYPMCIIFLSTTDSVRQTLSPRAVLRATMSLGHAYGMAVVVGIVFIMVSGLARVLLVEFAASAGGRLIGSGISALLITYLAFVELHILGRVVHENRHHLGWTIIS